MNINECQSDCTIQTDKKKELSLHCSSRPIMGSLKNILFILVDDEFKVYNKNLLTFYKLNVKTLEIIIQGMKTI